MTDEITLEPISLKAIKTSEENWQPANDKATSKAEAQAKLKTVMKKVLPLFNPMNDPEYARHVEVSKRLERLEKILEPEQAPRAEQLAKAKCIAVARLLWKQNPDFTRVDLAKHPDVYCKETDGGSYTQRTVYEWLAEADPRAKEDKTGRPRKVK